MDLLVIKSGPCPSSIDETESQIQRVQTCINTIEPHCYPDTPRVPPTSEPELSSPSISTMPNISYSSGAAYVDALKLRGVQTAPDQVPCPEQVNSLLDRLVGSDPTLAGENDQNSLFHATNTRDRASNEITFYLAFPFLITEYLCKLSALRYSINAQWKIEPLECDQKPTTSLAMPKPDMTIGFNTVSHFDHPAVNWLGSYSAPLPGDSDLVFPFVTLEAKPDNVVQALTQNLHNAAVMLRNLRFLSQKARRNPHDFDQKIRVLTIIVSRDRIEIFGHWTTSNDNQASVKYRHTKLQTWWLTNKECDWYDARAGMQKCIDWIIEETLGWITDDLRDYGEVVA